MRNLPGAVYWKVRDRLTRAPFLFRGVKARSGQGWFDTAATYEIEYPYRPGVAVVFRVYHRALILGVLDSHPGMDDDDIDYRLMRAIQSVNGGEAYCREAWEDRARRTVAAFAVSPSDQAELSSMLGLDDSRTEITGAETNGS